MKTREFVACRLLGRHVYRNRVPRVFNCEVYCLRCGRVFGSFDAPAGRRLWESGDAMRRLLVGDDWTPR